MAAKTGKRSEIAVKKCEKQVLLDVLLPKKNMSHPCQPPENPLDFFWFAIFVCLENRKNDAMKSPAFFYFFSLVTPDYS